MVAVYISEKVILARYTLRSLIPISLKTFFFVGEEKKKKLLYIPTVGTQNENNARKNNNNNNNNNNKWPVFFPMIFGGEGAPVVRKPVHFSDEKKRCLCRSTRHEKKSVTVKLF